MIAVSAMVALWMVPGSAFAVFQESVSRLSDATDVTTQLATDEGDAAEPDPQPVDPSVAAVDRYSPGVMEDVLSASSS